MAIRQVSVFIENRPGRLAEVTRLLGGGGVNIRALSLADTEDFGVLRFIASDPDAAKKILHGAGLTVRETPVLVVEVPDEPGGLAGALACLDSAGLNVEYMYAFVEKSGSAALVVLRVEAASAAEEVLRSSGYNALGEEVYDL
ncbi:MAG TPA: ACT domain-containing protein [Alphaproteobacteria bacterium]|nr:ACT domain-containing protein [Alphaproteobacteria bacterium]